MSSIQDSTSIPIILRNDESGIAWDLWRGRGMPDASSKEWQAIVSLLIDEKSPAQRGNNQDKHKIVDFLMPKRDAFVFRLNNDTKRRFGASKLPEGARIYKGVVQTKAQNNYGQLRGGSDDLRCCGRRRVLAPPRRCRPAPPPCTRAATRGPAPA